MRGGANAMLVLVQLGSGEEWVTMAHDDGTFRFIDLGPANIACASIPQAAASSALCWMVSTSVKSSWQ
ncbi:MAG: hypothetical protein R2867_09305 [Caldilineaceae bacterium]